MTDRIGYGLDAPDGGAGDVEQGPAAEPGKCGRAADPVGDQGARSSSGTRRTAPAPGFQQRTGIVRDILTTRGPLTEAGKGDRHAAPVGRTPRLRGR
ncbi:hypothetical protein [Actinoallomurus acaciae]|uniref:hypothetical protein n=1 Tax=Actinoallomurus acaciae TaxID=502577 RepID=UPI00366E2FA8